MTRARFKLAIRRGQVPATEIGASKGFFDYGNLLPPLGTTLGSRLNDQGIAAAHGP